MTGFVELLIMVWLGIFGDVPDKLKLKTDDNNYRAAIYSMQIDFSRVQEIMPEYVMPALPSSIVSHTYYIQYGKNTLIEIRDPGDEIEYLPVTMVTWDYSKKVFTSTLLLDQVRKYYTAIDTIPFSIEESRGTTKNLCDEVFMNSKCDSVKYVLNSTNKEYTVYSNGSITNLPSYKLFYPDIEYLPYKIMGVGRSKNTMILEEVIVGKPAIDSILNLFDFKGYAQITEREMNSIKHQYPIEVIEKLLPPKMD